MRAEELMLGRVAALDFDGLCELLGGFQNQWWRDLAFGHGEAEIPPARREAQTQWGFTVVRLVHFDMDFETAVLAQVWNDSHVQPQWEYVLLFNTGANDWVPEAIYGWGTVRPTFAQVGDVLDSFNAIRTAVKS